MRYGPFDEVGLWHYVHGYIYWDGVYWGYWIVVGIDYRIKCSCIIFAAH